MCQIHLHPFFLQIFKTIIDMVCRCGLINVLYQVQYKIFENFKANSAAGAGRIRCEHFTYANHGLGQILFVFVTQKVGDCNSK